MIYTLTYKMSSRGVVDTLQYKKQVDARNNLKTTATDIHSILVNWAISQALSMPIILSANPL